MGRAEVYRIICAICMAEAGKLTEVEDTTRLGFFRNECKPDPLPPVCPNCNLSALMRVK